MNNRYQVSVSKSGESVHVYIKSGSFSQRGYGRYVKKPNFLERLLGITFESKIKKAIEKTQKEIDKLNSNTQWGDSDYPSVLPKDCSGVPNKYKSTLEFIQNNPQIFKPSPIVFNERKEKYPMQDGYQ